MKLLYTPTEKNQLIAQQIFIDHENGEDYKKLSKKYGFSRNHTMALSHWYRDYGKK